MINAWEEAALLLTLEQKQLLGEAILTLMGAEWAKLEVESCGHRLKSIGVMPIKMFPKNIPEADQINYGN
jgi:hypothetical protein